MHPPSCCYLHIHTHTLNNSCMHVMCVHVCMHCVHVCMHVCSCMYVCMCIHVCMPCMYACADMCRGQWAALGVSPHLSPYRSSCLRLPSLGRLLGLANPCSIVLSPVGSHVCTKSSTSTGLPLQPHPTGKQQLWLAICPTHGGSVSQRSATRLAQHSTFSHTSGPLQVLPV